MTTAHGLAMLLGLVALIGSLRLAWQHLRTAAPARMRAWRLIILLLAQPVLAALLYFSLLPPPVQTQAGTLVVHTAQAETVRQDSLAGEVQVSLPEANAQTGIERVPDLATALRRHPGTQRIRVVGAGLEARDRDGLDGLAIDYLPSAQPEGVVELESPARVAVGAAFRVHGRVHGLAGGMLELIDPGMRVLDQQAITADGRFMLEGSVRVPGEMEFTLRVSDARKQVRESLPLPLQVSQQTPPRVLLLAGAPGPEVKYLRRWAIDAGLPLHTQLGVGAGGTLGDAPIAVNASSLRDFDVLLLDDRAWSGLGASARAAVQQAVREGLGVLLRVTGPLSSSDRAQWRAMGFVPGGGSERVETRLPESAASPDLLRARQGPGSPDAPILPEAQVSELPVLTHHALRIEADDAIALLRDKDGAALGQWRALGQGRVGLWTIADSHRLVLAGRSDRFGELWSQAFATLSRGRPMPSASLQGSAWQDQCAVLCGLDASTRLSAPDGKPVSLRIDPATGSRACAAFWPRQAGWHRLQQDGQAQALFVRAADSALPLQAHARQQATRLLALPSTAGKATGKGLPRRGSSWPWFLAWLACAAGLWWFERARIGRPRVTV